MTRLFERALRVVHLLADKETLFAVSDIRHISTWYEYR